MIELTHDGDHTYTVTRNGEPVRSFCEISCDYARDNAKEFAQKLALDEVVRVSEESEAALDEMVKISQETGQYDYAADRGGD